MGHRSARALTVAALLAAAVLPAARCPGQVRLAATAEAGWGGECAFSAEVAWPGSRAVAAWRGQGSPGADHRGSFALGLSLPWLRAGTLAPAGLLREAANPLGFGAGSDVFREDTSLRLDGYAEPSARLGLLVAPVPGRVGLYCRAAPRGGVEAGALACIQPLARVTVDLLAAAVQPASARPGDPCGPEAGEWYSTGEAAGLLAVAAARLRAGGPTLETSATAGTSGGQGVAPGHFLHLACESRGRAFSGALLVGFADGNWRDLSGCRASASARVSGRVSVRGPELGCEASVSARAGMPGIDPSAAVPAAFDLAGALEAGLGAGKDAVTIRLQAEAGLRAEAGSLTSVVSACALQAADRRATWKACCSLSGGWRPAGPGDPACGWTVQAVEATLQADPPGSPLSIRVEGRLGELALGGSLSARAAVCVERPHLRTAGPRGTSCAERFRMEAGFADLGLGPGSRAARLLLGVGWSAVQGSATPSRPPG